MPIRAFWRQRKAARELDSLEERLVWIGCGPRSGSTWLLNLMGLHPGVAMLNEPLIGLHLGLWTTDVLETPLRELPAEQHVWHHYRVGNPEYFFAPEFRSVWGPPLRTMMLSRFAAHIDRFGKDTVKGQQPVLCIKEPMGGQATDLVLDVLPRARMLELVRDPRDVVASLLDAYRDGSWFDKDFPGCNFAEVSREKRLRDFSTRWRVRTETALRAYGSRAPDQRLMVRYEDLRADPEQWLETIFTWAGVAKVDVGEYVERMSFERASSTVRGEGRFHRKAKPGSWDETLSPDEVAVVEQICAGPMAHFGYEPAAAARQDLTAATP